MHEPHSFKPQLKPNGITKHKRRRSGTNVAAYTTFIVVISLHEVKGLFALDPSFSSSVLWDKNVVVVEANQERSMEPIATTATENVLNSGVEVIKRHVGYLCHYKDNVGVIHKYVRDLKDARERVQHQVKEAEDNTEEIEADVQNWLKEVGEKITEYENFLSDGGHAKTGCSIGFFPNNLLLRYKLGRKATKVAEGSNANELANKKFDRVSYRPSPSIEAVLSNIDYESFPSREKTMEGIMKALEDSTIRMIGVYGAGGMGKTTLVKEVAKKALENKLFNVVVMANITRNPDIKKVQGQIAEMLGMRLEEESEIVRAAHLQKRLNKEKENTLIILDDLWDGLDLNILGIPCGGGDDGGQTVVKDVADSVSDKIKEEKPYGDYKGCKILLTTRKEEVLRKMDVKTNTTFTMEILDEKEVETLFKKKAGIQDKSEFENIAIEIAKLCAGFPIAIVSIGRALKNKGTFVWEDVRRQLKGQNFTEAQQAVEFSLKLSYLHLENEELKSIFLLCARMGNDPLIMDLVKYCFGLGMLEGIKTIREAKDRVQVLIKKLKDSSLLVKSYSNDRFNMHDIVRDVALSIASKEKHVFTMKNGKLDEWPDKNKLKRCTVIYIHYCDIFDEFPKCIYCPRLEVFHVDSNDPLLKIPDSFFKGMRELKVLILTGIHLSCLPSSIKYLTNLRMLCLERCTLGENLSIIGELKKLRILTLSGSSIESLPVELGDLGKLQLFDISNCSKLSVIPSNIISRLSSLEELYMRDNSILWEVKQRNQSENAFLSELRHLNELTTLEIHIPSVVHFPQDMFFDMLGSYKIVIGEFNMLSMGDFKIPGKYEATKFLALQLKDGGDIHCEKGIKILFRRVEKLLLGELNGVQDVLSELNFEGFPNLKHLSIVNNYGIQYIIKSLERLQPLEAFPELESIYLYKMENIKKICDNQLTDASFRRLKVIKIKLCGQLQNIFSFFMVRLLNELETIEVCDCDSLKEIVYVERQVNTINDVKDDKIEFPQLRFLTLESLTAFTCFYADDMKPSISQLYEDQVPNEELEEVTTEARQDACFALFDEKVSMPKLECLGLSSINTQKIWSDQSLPSHCFQDLLTLKVTDCCNLNYLLSFSMAGSLVNLQSLSVSGCELMEDIFSKEDAREIDVFPKLKNMEITDMEKLNTIWHPHIGLHSFQYLESVIIKECHKLVMIFPGYMWERFQSLQSLKVINCKLVENIFDLGDTPSQIDCKNETNLHIVYLEELPNLVHVWKEDAQGSLNFNNLRKVFVRNCPNLENVFPLCVARCLEKLESLTIVFCSEMKEIIARGERSNENTVKFEFPQLKLLSLHFVSKLENFYQGEHTIEWPSLKTLWLLGCGNLEAWTKETTSSKVKPIFLATEKVISNLEHMGISLKHAKWLQDYIGNIHRMHKLQSLLLDGLQNAEILFWFLLRIPNLECLVFLNCYFKEVWTPGNLAAHEKIGTVVKLKKLRLQNMPFLSKIGFEYDLLLQRVERLVLRKCSNLINLAPSSVSFIQVTYLEVQSCSKLTNLMASSTAKSLVQLETLKVIKCTLMKEIVAENIDEEEKVEEIDFRHLKALELVSLESLTSFCSSENCDLRFPVLEKLIVSECPRMKKFTKGVKSHPKLQGVCVAEEEDGDRWYWEGDLNATIQKIFIDKVSFEYAKHLRLSDHPEFIQVWHGKISLVDNCFRNLKTLVVESCEFLKDLVIPSNVLPCLKNLEELEVRRCNAVEVIFDINDTEMKRTKGMAFRLKKMSLNQLPQLKHVWKKNPQGIVSFPNLQEVITEDCGSLKTLLPASLARNLVKLKILKIQNCHVLAKIVGKEDADSHGLTNEVVFEFPCLTTLVLFWLPQITCFYPGRHHLEFPKLESLDVSYCGMLKLFTSDFRSRQEALSEDQVSTPTNQEPLFLVEKVIPNLKELALNEKDIIMLSDGRLPPDLLHKLNLLKLHFEDANEKATLPFEFLHKVPNLEILRVGKFIGLKEIFPSQKLEVDNGIFVRLKELYLHCLDELNSIGLEHSWVKTHCEKLEKLSVVSCSSLKNLVCCSVSFSNLKKLLVENCHGLKYLFTFSTAKSLVQLESMIIWECQSMKEIVTKGDESASDEIIFGRLNNLILDSLPSLGRFYSGNATVQFSCLVAARVIQCPMLKTFSEGVIKAPVFCIIRASREDTDFHFHNGLETTIEKLFQEKVTDLILGDHPELQNIWLGELPVPDKCFSNLKSLVVERCEFLSNAILPSHLFPFLRNLEELKVQECNSVEAIFDVRDIPRDQTNVINVGRAFPLSLPLKKLIIKELPTLKHFWNVDPQGILSLPFLQEVFVDGCKSVRSLFPASMAKDKLEKLSVINCRELEEIVAKDDAATEGAIKKLTMFPSVSLLTLRTLPKLKCICPGVQTLEWPVLKELDVYHCDMLKILATEFQSCPDSLPEDQERFPIDQQTLVSFGKDIPHLEQLTLTKEDAMLVGQGQVWENTANLLQNLKFLKLQCFHNDDQSNIFSFGFLQNLLGIEKLGVVCSSFNEIFSSERPNVDCTKILSKLKGLQLDDLSKLNSIGLEHSWVQPLLKTLETLEVWKCSSLEILVPSTVTFSNLTDLDIYKCLGLVYLFTSSTAKSLGLLKKMSIRECVSLREIVTEEEDHETYQDEIIFEQLSTVSLHSLPRLAGFYKGSFKLQFPSLQNLTVSKCLSMKIFCQGDIHAPKMPSHPNTMIREIFQEAVEHLILADHSEIEEIWLGVLPIPTNKCFNNLKSLIVVKCDSLSKVIPFNLIPFLHNLEEMEVSNCESVKAIFEVKDAREDIQMVNMEPASLVSLPLKKLTLKQLPNLDHICNMNTDGIFSLQDMQVVSIKKCQSLKSLFQTSVANHLVKLEKLEVKYCEGLVEIIAEGEADLKGVTKQFVFPSLTSLTLRGLPELKHYYPEKHSLEWPMLKELDIFHCDKLQLFTTEHQSGGNADPEDQQAIISVEKVFPKLEKLLLKKEDAMMIWQGQFQANLDRVKSLALCCFHDESDIFPYVFLQKVPNMKGLGVGCSSFKEIFSSERPNVDYTEVLSQLKGLYLKSLSKLRSIGLEHSWVQPLLETLETLKVLQCSCLETLVPSTVSFSNLTDLTVGECHGLVYLLTSSTARSLGMLRQMSIHTCESMQEIVGEGEGHESDHDKIIFGQLNTVALHSLPRLVSFYSGSSKLEFPSLQEVSVSECDSMRIFCEGEILAPQMPSHPNMLIRKIFDETVERDSNNPIREGNNDGNNYL